MVTVYGYTAQESESPFKRFVNSIGLDYSKLPRFTNGQIMALAESDRTTMHRWSYKGGDLPEDTLELMKFKLLRDFPIEQFGI